MTGAPGGPAFGSVEPFGRAIQTRQRCPVGAAVPAVAGRWSWSWSGARAQPRWAALLSVRGGVELDHGLVAHGVVGLRHVDHEDHVRHDRDEQAAQQLAVLEGREPRPAAAQHNEQ